MRDPVSGDPVTADPPYGKFGGPFDPYPLRVRPTRGHKIRLSVSIRVWGGGARCR